VTTPEPKPSRLHVALSIVVIGECLFLFSAGIACLTVTWDPCAMFSGILLAPLPGFLGIVQYAGTFRRHTASARRATTCAFILGGIIAFVFGGATIVVLVAGELPPREIIIPLLAFAVPHLWNGFLNRRWHHELIKSASLAGNGRFRLSIRELLGLTTVVSVFAALTLYFVRGQGPQFAENISASEAGIHLPANAANVSLCHGYRGIIAYEFDTDEQSFRQWVDDGIGSLESQQANIKLAPIKGDYTMSRYYSLSSQLAGPDSVTIHDGLYYEWSFEDRGVYAAFDRATGLAYFYAHFH